MSSFPYNNISHY